jgi:hypothetical protein
MAPPFLSLSFPLLLLEQGVLDGESTVLHTRASVGRRLAGLPRCRGSGRGKGESWISVVGTWRNDRELERRPKMKLLPNPCGALAGFSVLLGDWLTAVVMMQNVRSNRPK